MTDGRTLPDSPSLVQLRKLARDLKRQFDAGDESARTRSAAVLGDRAALATLRLTDAQHVLAREYGSRNWSELKATVEAVQQAGPESGVSASADDLLGALLPVPQDHRSGSADEALRLLKRQPELAGANIWSAAACGELERVRDFLNRDPDAATRRGGPRDWDALLYLAFSRFLRTDPERAERMVEIATLLLQHGADPDTHWVDTGEYAGSRESALYGAAGIANNVELTRVLFDAGADPNDGETAYHSVEHDGCPCVPVVWPRFDDINRGTALLHKLDYPDLEGLRVLLELGADPNGPSPFPNKPLHQAIFRGHGLEYFELLLAHGADVNLSDRNGQTPYAAAARSGRHEIVAWLERHGADTTLGPREAFLACCARGDTEAARAMTENRDILGQLDARDRSEICELADAGNTAGVRTMLELGWDINTRGRVWRETALHRAAMQGRHETVRLLFEAGADLTVRDASYHASPIGWAAHGGHRDIAALLASDPARLDLRDATECGHTARVLELLADADVNAAVLGGDEGVLLRAAAASGSADLVSALLQRGADPLLCNREGRNAADIARAAGHPELISLLETGA